MVEAAVAGDPVKPGAEVDLALVGEHRSVGVDEDLLEDVLGVLGGAQHLPAEAEQAALVAVDERLEGAGVATPRHRDQAVVALELEQRRAPGEQSALTGVCECGCLQVSLPGKPLSSTVEDTVAVAKLRSRERLGVIQAVLLAVLDRGVYDREVYD